MASSFVRAFRRVLSWFKSMLAVLGLMSRNFTLTFCSFAACSQGEMLAE